MKADIETKVARVREYYAGVAVELELSESQIAKFLDKIEENVRAGRLDVAGLR